MKKYKVTLRQPYVQYTMVTFEVESNLSAEELESEMYSLSGDWSIAGIDASDITSNINDFIEDSFSTWEGHPVEDGCVTVEVEDSEE